MLIVKQGRYGKFLACPGFPECRNTKPLLKEMGVACPKCGGNIVERRTKRGRVFFGCKNYPNCDYVTWDTPLKETCPTCTSFMLKHHYKNGRALLYCSNEACETRVDHPINKELEKLREKAAAKEAAKSEPESATVPVKAAPKKTRSKAKKTTVKKPANKKPILKKKIETKE